MKKILYILSIILILNSCDGFEFIYKLNKNDSLIKNTTNIDIGGDDADQIYILLRDRVGNQEDSPKYKLLVHSLKTESAKVINKDATASKFNIKYSINYELYNLHKNCKIFKRLL